MEDFQAQLLLDEEEGLSLAAAGAPVPNECAGAGADDDDANEDDGDFHDGDWILKKVKHLKTATTTKVHTQLVTILFYCLRTAILIYH